VTPVEGADGNVWLGKDLREHAADYGITEIAAEDVMRLYRP